jgi:hypothetical protein
VSTVNGDNSLPRSVRPGIVEEINALLDGVGEYDGSLQARLRVLENSLEKTRLGLVDALGGYAIAGTTHLGVLAGPSRRRIGTVCDVTGTLSIDDITERFGFVTTLDELLDTAAYQLQGPEVDTETVRKRLQYLYGAARADLGLDVEPEHFVRGIASRVRRDAPDRWDLPARVRAAEYKTAAGYDVGDAPRGVKRVLAVDSGFGANRDDPPRKPFSKTTPDEGETAPTEAVDPTTIAFWGCPFCDVTGSAHEVLDHVQAANGPHGHRTSRHVPGYDDNGTLRAAVPASHERGRPPVRADSAPLQRWTTPEQRDAAMVGVPMRTLHTESGVESILADRHLQDAMDPNAASDGFGLGNSGSNGTTSPGRSSEDGTQTLDWLTQD